jgi:hypothetical protein
VGARGPLKLSLGLNGNGETTPIVWLPGCLLDKKEFSPAAASEYYAKLWPPMPGATLFQFDDSTGEWIEVPDRTFKNHEAFKVRRAADLASGRAPDPDSAGRPSDIHEWPRDRRNTWLAACREAVLADSDYLLGRDRLDEEEIDPLVDIGKEWDEPKPAPRKRKAKDNLGRTEDAMSR